MKQQFYVFSWRGGGEEEVAIIDRREHRPQLKTQWLCFMEFCVLWNEDLSFCGRFQPWLPARCCWLASSRCHRVTLSDVILSHPLYFEKEEKERKKKRGVPDIGLTLIWRRDGDQRTNQPNRYIIPLWMRWEINCHSTSRLNRPCKHWQTPMLARNSDINFAGNYFKLSQSEHQPPDSHSVATLIRLASSKYRLIDGVVGKKKERLIAITWSNHKSMAGWGGGRREKQSTRHLQPNNTRR